VSLNRRYFAPLLVAAGTTGIVVAPVAAADPVWPVGGAEPADATIEDLETQGYDVQINWVSGYPTVPLSECWVDAIHNPDGPPSRTALSIVYVDIGCPSNNFD
jgi:hypothetical protein